MHVCPQTPFKESDTIVNLLIAGGRMFAQLHLHLTKEGTLSVISRPYRVGPTPSFTSHALSIMIVLLAILFNHYISLFE